MKKILLLIIIFIITGRFAISQSNLWMDIPESNITLVGERYIVPDSYRTVKVNFENLQCRTGHDNLRLTPREAMVLKYLVDHKGKIVSRKELLENVWGISSDIETRTVDNFILRMRKYFELNPSEPIYFKSVRSVGYIFDDT